MTEMLYRGAGKAQEVQRDIEHKASEKRKPLSELLAAWKQDPQLPVNAFDSLTGDEMARRLRALDEMHEKDYEHGNCKADGFPWPCPDHLILDGETK